MYTREKKKEKERKKEGNLLKFYRKESPAKLRIKEKKRKKGNG
jgi:hypothetical protein